MLLIRWAAEGLSFLTLDAEVKEKLVEDESAMRWGLDHGENIVTILDIDNRALLELVKTGAHNVIYGVLATLVNITTAMTRGYQPCDAGSGQVCQESHT